MFDPSLQIPSHTVSLPSNGLIYPEGSVFFAEKDVDFSIMTAKQEDLLMNPSLVRKGKSILHLMKSCVTNVKISDLENLLIGDKDAILIGIRVSGYGELYEPTFECPKCENDINVSLHLSQIKIKRLSLNPVKENQNVFSYVLPHSKHQVLFKFLTYKDEIEITNNQEALVTEKLKRSIVSFNGDSDREVIDWSVDNMNVKDSRALRTYIESNEPGVDLGAVANCTYCENSIDFQIPKNHEFFSIKPEDRELVLLEPFFNLAYYFGMSWETYYAYPVSYRRWLMERLNKEIKSSRERGEQPMPTHGSHHNDPELRALMGKTHPHAPPNLRKF